jgi:lipopolysaccharide export system ATP-binding protein
MLKVDSIELQYDGRKILQDIYLDCKPAETVGLLGRNGCGKSSLLKIIFGCLKPGFKHISINDKTIEKGYQNNKIAYLPQHHYLPAATPIFKLAKLLVDPLSWNEFSEQSIYQKHFQKKSNQLSGGEIRQLETLMILYSKADYILLDEPFIHLSPIQAEEFKEIIRKRSQVKGIIVTDHQYYNILEISDKVILLNNGCTKPIKSAEDLITYGYINHII